MVEDWYKDKEKGNQYPRELVMGEFLRRNADRFPDRLAVVYKDRRYTYREFNARVNRLANALIALGVKKGDCIGIFAHNSDRCVEVAIAITKVGAIFIPINFRLVGHEVEYILNFNDSVAVFVDHAVLDVVAGVRDKLVAKHIIVMQAEGAALPEGMLNYDEVSASAGEQEPDVDVWEGDIAGLAQTGGTTGRPKSVFVGHRAVCSIIYQICFIHNYLEDDRGLQAMPSYSSAGIAYDWGATLFHGGTLYIAPLPPFDPVGILDIIHRERINHLTLAPVMVDFILAFLEASPGKYDVSCGRTALGQEIKIIDPKGNELPRGEVGEIVVAGTMVTRGYKKNPDANRAAFHGRFLGIGDMGYMDKDGYIFIVDRKSDMIISGGMNIYPAEIEAVMIDHPQIAEVAVIGIPDEQWGESVKAIVRLAPGQEVSGEDIIAWCKGKMAGYRVPKSVDFVADFPRTATGKVQKSVLRQEYWKDAGRKV